MKLTLVLIILFASSALALGHPPRQPVRGERNARIPAAPQCARENLKLKEGDTDAAMAGVRQTDFLFTNTSSSPCTLNGYPRVELLNRRGLAKKHAVSRAQLPGDSEVMPPRLVTIEAGQTAWFRIYFNAGGAGHMGPPCPTYPRVRVTAPRIARAFVLKSDIQSCPGTEFQVSSVRSGSPGQ